ncbi:MAG TPA: Hpt domain-containing protein [Xanthobacteraceae bacterium]|nr:Hpt domain-containing protein [Xanthobacteraceae bacterium]
MTAGRPPAGDGVPQRRSLAALLSADELAEERRGYLARLRGHALTLARLRAALRGAATPAGALDELRTVAHKLAGSAGLYGFEALGVAAATLEESIIERRSGDGGDRTVAADLDALLDRIECEQAVAAIACDA